MSAWWSKWRLAVWAGMVTLVFFVALSVHGGLWEKFGVEDLRLQFADTVTTLAGAKTWAEGGDPYANNYNDPYRRPHSYGPWWLWAGRLGLGPADAGWIGALTLLSFLVAASAVAAPRTTGEAIALVLLFCSPPLLLGLERGNSDLPVFVLLALAGWLLGRGAQGRPGAGLGGSAVIVASAALKFYPLISLIALWGQPGPAMRRIIWGALGAVAFFVLWWLQDEHYVRALREAARPRSIFTYGLPLAPMSWELLEQHRVWLLIGAIPALTVVAWAVARGAREFWAALPVAGGRAAAAVAGGAAWLLCYVSTTNFGYRAVLLVFFWRYWWQSRAGRVLAGLLLIAFWLDAPKYQVSGALSRLGPGARELIVVMSGFAQAAVFGVSVVVALMLVGWAWRRERGAQKS